MGPSKATSGKPWRHGPALAVGVNLEHLSPTSPKKLSLSRWPDLL